MRDVPQMKAADSGDSLDASEEPVSILSLEEDGKVQQQVPPAWRPQQIHHPISHLQRVMVPAILLQVIHHLLVGRSRQSLLKLGYVALCCLLPPVFG